MSDPDGGEIFQESPRLKAIWLEEMKVKFPVGCKVKVIGSDVDCYIGATGKVADYDIGFKGGADGSWPLVGVVFDAPIECEGSVMNRDGFYDDELERIDLDAGGAT